MRRTALVGLLLVSLAGCGGQSAAPGTPLPVVTPDGRGQLRFDATGSALSQSFSLTRAWSLSWTVDCSSAPGGTMTMTVQNADGSDAGVSPIQPSPGVTGDSVQVTQTGSFRLDVETPCAWSAVISAG